MNQMRSPLAEAALRNFFPQFEFFSAGIFTQANSSPDPRIVATSQNWNLGKIKSSSSGLIELKGEILNSNLVVTAESWMNAHIRNLGFRGNLVSFDSIAADQDSVPIDPVGIPIDHLNQELAKVVLCSVRAIRSNFELKNANHVNIFIPNHEIDSVKTFETARLFQTKTPGFLIDVDFRAPGAKLNTDVDRILTFDSIQNLIDSELNQNSTYTPHWECTRPEAILLSSEFAQLIKQLSDQKPVYLVSAPRRTAQRKIADSYLASVWADTVTTISS